MKPNATEPRKIYPHEVFLDGRGAQRISPDAFLRLSWALGEDGAFTRGDSAPRKVVSKASLNGAHQEKDSKTDHDGEGE